MKGESFTRESDDMNEVLADFIGYEVWVGLKDSTSVRGKLEVNPAEYTDGYLIGTQEIEKDDVLELIDMDDRE